MAGKSQILRDARLRLSVAQSEIQRRALLYVARNTTLEQVVRHRAQLQLNNMPGDTRAGRVKNRCGETGRGRGVMNEFGLCRVSLRRGARAKRGRRGEGDEARDDRKNSIERSEKAPQASIPRARRRARETPPSEASIPAPPHEAVVGRPSIWVSSSGARIPAPQARRAPQHEAVVGRPSVSVSSSEASVSVPQTRMSRGFRRTTGIRSP